MSVVLLSANRGPLKVKALLPIRTRQPARALQNTSRLRPLLITQPGWAYTSVTDYPYARRQPLSHHACSSLISSHAYGLCIAGRNSSPTAFTLSSPAVAAAIGQIRGCFLLKELRPWQLTICYIFLASFASVFGATISRLYSMQSSLLFGTQAN